MGDVEEYFPRGGKKPVTTHFKQNANFLGAPEKGEKKRKKPKKKTEGDDGYLSDEGTREIDQSYKNCSHGISYKTIKEGVLILGRVKTILETKVVVSLPCRMLGSVMACHISEPYNKIIEAYVNDKTDTVLELGQMFRPGQYIGTKVLEVNGMSLMLSTMPQHVNGQKSAADLHKGTLLQAAVSSVEDHGYVMDIGVSNTRAFLPKSNTNPEVELDAGMITWCVVKSAPSEGVVTLSTELSALQSGSCRRKQSSPLLPATTVDFVVDTPLDNGIEGHIFGDTTGYIQRTHADTVRGKKPALGQKIPARLLYVMPTRNTPFLTMKNIFASTYPDLKVEQTLQDGQIIEEAQVLKITGRSIHFKLSGGCFGTMSLKRIQIDEDLTDEEVVAKSYPIGSTHKVRVLCYNLSDYVYSVTDQPDVVAELYFSLDQLHVGDTVDATVKIVADNHVLLNVGRVTGYVSKAHLTDSGIFVDTKAPSSSKLPKKKFKVGQLVKARVLVVDPVKHTLFLTLKPSLLAPDVEVLANYEDALVGKAYTGVIKTVRDFLLVSFFNNVCAIVPKHYVTKEPIDNLTDAYHLGQIVNCTILRVDPETKKMTGSLTTAPFWPNKKREKGEKRKQNDDNAVPSKKQKSDEQTDKKTKKHKKPEEEVGQEAETLKKGKKKRNISNSEQSDKSTSELENEQVNKKSKKLKQGTDNSNIEHEEIASPKKNKKDKKSNKISSDNSNTELETNQNNDKKRKNKQEKQIELNPELEGSASKKNKVKKETIKKEVTSEESDAIETDIQEDKDKTLAPQDLVLIDLSNCTTIKHFKKRAASLLKAIGFRNKRIQRNKHKIDKLEKNGITPGNKKLHTSLHTEILLLEDRIKQLNEASDIAQTKLKELGFVQNTDYKLEQKLKKKEKKGKESSVVQKEKKNEIKVVEKLEPALEVPSVKEFWSAQELSEKVVEESSSSEDEEKDQPKKKRKKLTVAEKLAKAREEEERVREMERRAIESETQPRSSEQFERALLANPNSSELWIAYMAFHLQATEVEKARAVGKKALNTISFREELDKLNVWLALINLETRFGTNESLQQTLENALQMNDPYKIHSKLLDIYTETSKHQELVTLVDLMMRKYKRVPECYVICGSACFKLGLVDKARQVMQKAIAVLEKKEHVTVLVQFALLERSHGARERAEALFEQVLAVYPQRVDICSAYVDMLLKSGEIDSLRQVMERMTSQKLAARKMKILYKKWIEVEEKIGNEDQVEKLKHRAMDYIQKAKF